MFVLNRSSEEHDVPLVPLPITQVLPEDPLIVTLPVFAILKRVVVTLAVDEPTANNVCNVEPLLACTESCANGVVVPMPTLPALEIRSRSTILVY